MRHRLKAMRRESLESGGSFPSKNAVILVLAFNQSYDIVTAS